MRGKEFKRDLTAAGKRGAAAMHAAVKAGPRVDSYFRKVDVRGQFAREEAERRRGRR